MKYKKKKISLIIFNIINHQQIQQICQFSIHLNKINVFNLKKKNINLINFQIKVKFTSLLSVILGMKNQPNGIANTVMHKKMIIVT